MLEISNNINMLPKAHIKKISKIAHHVFPFVLCVVGIIVIAGVIAKVGNPKKIYQQTPLTPVPTAPPLPPHTTYTSDKLGISFTYINTVADRQNFFTKEIGDTVYLYYNIATNQPFTGTDDEFLKTIPGHGVSVEVFNKDPQQSLKDAIKQQFLTGYSENDCFVNTTPKGHPTINGSYQIAIIDFPHNPGQSRKQLEDSVAKCPNSVNSFDFVRYFMIDPKHPDKLLLINIGQDDIPSGLGGVWDGTIKVLQ